jgi:membrane-associated phospholipid phosphatase
MARGRAIVVPVLAALVVLTTLVATGSLRGADQFAVSHWMPWLAPRRHALLDVTSLLVPARHGTVAARALDAWTYPASVLASAVIVAVCAYRTRRWILVALWVAGNAVELVGKLALGKPALFTAHHVHVTGFDHSYPSGHTIRGALVAAAVAVTWPRVAPVAAVWFATVPFVLVVLGYHTPTDVIGGALVAALLLTPLLPARAPRSGSSSSAASRPSRAAPSPDPDP